MTWRWEMLQKHKFPSRIYQWIHSAFMYLFSRTNRWPGLSPWKENTPLKCENSPYILFLLHVIPWPFCEASLFAPYGKFFRRNEGTVTSSDSFFQPHNYIRVSITHPIFSTDTKDFVLILEALNVMNITWKIECYHVLCFTCGIWSGKVE